MSTVGPSRRGLEEELSSVFELCKAHDWSGVLQRVQRNPTLATSPMLMPNNITTTILHQAISSKNNNMKGRKSLILGILDIAGPVAVMIKNGYGSLPLHVILQRNTKMDSATKEQLVFALIEANELALMEEGGVGKRTPLHIAFTDYISPELARFMIQRGHRAANMVDRKGWLPIHVACSRHVSPEKLQMLLDANPQSLVAVTNNGESLLNLAVFTATKSHPNYALIGKIKQLMEEAGVSTEAMTTSSSPAVSTTKRKHRSSLKRNRQVQPDDAAVDLLIHFHRNSGLEAKSPMSIEEV